MKSSIILFSVFLLFENNIIPAISGNTLKKGNTILKEKNKYFLDSSTQEENKIRKQLEDGKDILMKNLKDENIWQLDSDEINKVFKIQATQLNNVSIIGAELLGLVSSFGTDLLLDMLDLHVRDLPQDINKHLKELSWNQSEATNLSEFCIILMESWRTKVLYKLSTIKTSIIDQINKVFDFIQVNNPDMSDLEVWEDEPSLGVPRNNLIESAKKDVSEIMTNGEKRMQRMSTSITKRFSELIDGISTKVNDLFTTTKCKLQDLAVAANLKWSSQIHQNYKLIMEIMADLVMKKSDIIIDSSAAVNKFLFFIRERMDEIKNWSDQEMNKINTTPKVMIPRNMF
uniref:Uncharacterized protein n=1 Tax=Clastoptera arizonana TaxID=38151 RepID=A0A1B6EBM1_9HEMI